MFNLGEFNGIIILSYIISEEFMKALLICLCIVLMTGCGMWERTKAKYTGYSKVCVDNVTYLQFSSGVTPQLDTNGNVVVCK